MKDRYQMEAPRRARSAPFLRRSLGHGLAFDMQRRRPQVRLDVAHVGVFWNLDVGLEPLPRTLPGRMLRAHVRAGCVQSSMRQSHFPLRRRVGLDDGELRPVVGPGVSVWRAVAQEAVGVAAAAGGWARRERRLARHGCCPVGVRCLLWLCEVLLLRLTASGVRDCVRRFATVRAKPSVSKH